MIRGNKNIIASKKFSLCWYDFHIIIDKCPPAKNADWKKCGRNGISKAFAGLTLEFSQEFYWLVQLKQTMRENKIL